MREIIILPVLNGWRVRIGCQEVVFESAAKLVNELHDYLLLPEATESRYREHSVNKRLLAEPQVPMPVGESEVRQAIRRQHEQNSTLAASLNGPAQGGLGGAR